MARGYPTPREEPPPLPETGLDPLTCPICRRNAIPEPFAVCGECRRKLDASA